MLSFRYYPLLWSEAKWSWSVVSDCQTPELCPLWSCLGPANTGVGLLAGGHLAAQPRATACVQLGFYREEKAVWRWDEEHE